MSTISVSTVTTANNSENLTLSTGNSTSAKVVVPASGGVQLFGNSTAERLVSNSVGSFFTGNVTIATGNANILTANIVSIVANGSVGTDGQFLTSNGTVSYWSTATVPVAATQAEQETATSTTTFVSPGRQHFHPSAAKFWAHFGVTGNLLAGYNVTSITDNGPGVATVVIATDFGTSDYCVGVSAENQDPTIDSIADGQMTMISSGLQAAGSVQVLCKNDDGTAAADPLTWNVWGFGDFV